MILAWLRHRAMPAAEGIVFCAGLLLSAMPVAAAAARTDHVEAELVAEVESVKPGQPFWVALRLEMIPAWHTYWKNPGDSGLPTKIKWTLPEGFLHGPIHWPYPERIDLPPLANYGYEGEVFLLVEISPPEELAANQPITLVAKADWLACEEICVPEGVEVELTLPVAKATPQVSPWSEKFSQMRWRLPLAETEWSFTAVMDAESVQITGVPPQWFGGRLTLVTFFPDEPGVIEHFSEQQFRWNDRSFVLRVDRAKASDKEFAELRGVLVTHDGWRGPGSEAAAALVVPIEEVEILAALPDLVGSAGLTRILAALGLAFVGGMILNLMPCVFPILSIKILGFVKQAGGDQRMAWKHGLVFTAGILVCFWLLSGALIALRSSGEQIGWGFQLQSPAFLICLAALFFLLALNLFGVFEVGTSFIGLGSDATGKSGWWGDFFSGLLATVIATPCTAPFMGAALGFALSQPTWVSMLIFTSLGLGMALPYLILSIFPALLRFIPRPGAWMESLKQMMGFLLMATVVWLAWVLSQQTDPLSIANLLGGLWLIGLGSWVLGRWGSFVRGTTTKLVARLVAVALLGIGLAWPLSTVRSATMSPAAYDAGGDDGGIAWKPFSPELVFQSRSLGKPVFVDFTAAWCLTCQVNERVAFSSKEVQEKFTELAIVPVKADWTNRDESITQALAQFGRSGVPFYVIYPPEIESAPIILPEILTPNIVLEALKKLE